MAYVYRHIRLDKNEPFYIGIGSDSDDKYTRAYSKRRRNKIWESIVSRSEYNVEILLDGITWEEACEKEKEFISLYGRIDLKSGILANLTNGGDGSLGVIQGLETRIKKSISSKNRIMSDESKKKISDSKIGKKRPRYVSDKVSEGLKRYYANNPNPRIGIPLTDATKKKLSDTMSGRPSPNLGKKMSQESKNKLSLYNKYEKNAVAIMVIDITTGVFFQSISQAAEAYNFNSTTLNKWVRNKRKNKTNLRLI